MESGTSKSPHHHQKRMGPAPFASFEDLSDEMDSPSEKEVNVIRLPGITEQEASSPSPDPDSRRSRSSGIGARTSPLPHKIKLANTPRIDISRASSSSHHDSRDSTPEREMYESAETNVKLGLGFKEDDALELRLSTEELDFHDADPKASHHYKHRSASPEFDELYINHNQRKDSQCSDVVLLSISGRTSRVSSIGSQGSAQSRLSNASHISVTSGHSAYSQCSSPHKTLLETSFCGNKGSQSDLQTEEVNEKILLRAGEALKHKEEGERAKLPRKIIAKSGVEYIYIPLKGPLPEDDEPQRHKKPLSAPPALKATSEPKYIRIKLKPDHCYEDSKEPVLKPPSSLNLRKEQQKHARSLTNSPKLLRKEASPSQAVPRRNSFVTLFRTGPDSPGAKQKKKPTLTKKARSSTESVDSKGTKHKSSVLSLFKAKQQQKSNGSTPVPVKKPEKPLIGGETIRIPLHSPTYYENKSLLQELQASSQDSQVTVVEVAPKTLPSPLSEAQSPEEPLASAQAPEQSESIIGEPLNSDSLLLDTAEHNSSESERDLSEKISTETERKAIVLQQDSFEDELPYVPTTLPQERSAALPIVPVNQRCALDIKACLIERPRSTTPIQPSNLENYFEAFSGDAKQREKLKIYLPNKSDSPPPLPPKGVQKQSWINFEEVPERRKPPKHIQTIPSRGQIDNIKDNVVYTYVNPDECKCECHEHRDPVQGESAKSLRQEDELPLLNQAG